MLKHLCVTLGLCFLGLSQAKGQGLQYGGMQQLSIVVREQRVTAGFTLVNGVRFRRFFTGIGVDLQTGRSFYYYNHPERTSAIYGDGRYYINKKKNFFGKVNGGVNLVSSTPRYSGSKYKNFAGYYGACGLGFKARIGNEVFYSFDVSYSLRQTRFNHTYLNFMGGWQTDKYNLIYSAIMVQMGIEIF